MPVRPRRSLPRFLIVPLLLIGTLAAHGNPTGATIRHGQIQLTRNGGNLRILQGSNRAIIDWDSFSIANGQTTRFIHPGRGSATLNRVSGPSASLLNGALRSNGTVFLLNPNGIVVGPTGTIDAGGFAASTLDVSDSDFLGGGDLRFRGNSQQGVINLGNIDAAGGDVFLIAATVRNGGTISADGGTVGLAAGNDVLLKASGEERVFVRGAGGGKKANGVLNEGTIRANIAELKAHGGNVYGIAVNNKGRVAATGISREGGQIFLRARGSRRSRVRNTGTLKASQSGGNGGRVTVTAESDESLVENAGTVDVIGGSGSGGEILILGSEVQLEPRSLIIADGTRGGGRIYIGGGERGQDSRFFNAFDVTVHEGATISANSSVRGDGGKIIVFADNRLDFSGRISATGGSSRGDGGFIELSGKNEVLTPDLSSRIRLTAENGRSGTLLFDPNDITIVDGPASGGIGSSPTNANTLNDGDVNDFLTNVGNLVIETNPVPTTGNGDIIVNSGAEILWNTSNSLTFNATRDFSVIGGSLPGRITSQGSGDLNINAGRTIGIFSSAVVSGNAGQTNLIAGASVRTFAGTVLSTTDGDIVIEANTSGTSPEQTTGLQMGGSLIATNGSGDITITARGGADNSTPGRIGVDINNSAIRSNSTAADAGSISITGTGGVAGIATDYGIRLTNGAIGIQSVNGDITLVGNGSGGGNFNSGIFIGSGRVVSTGTGANAADISISANASPVGVSNSPGLLLSGSSRILSADGDVAITATGGGTGTGNHGVEVNSGSRIDVSGDGNVTLRGTGVNGADGVNFNEASALVTGISTGSGNVVIESDQNIEFDGTGVDIASTSGDILVNSLLDVAFRNTSSAGSVSGSFSSSARTFSILDDGTLLQFDGGNVDVVANRNIIINGDTAGILSSTGQITLEANTDGSETGNFDGILLENNTLVRVGNGSISITATGGTLTVGNRGIRAEGAIISATGVNPGLISLNGTGGNGTVDQLMGVGLFNNTQITSNGDISIKGTGGGAAGADQAVGIDIFSANVQTSGGGNITFDGTGGAGTNAHGTRISSRVEATGTGGFDILGKSGTDTTSRGFILSLAGEVVATTGDISIETDSIVLGTGNNIQSSGDLFIIPNDSTLAINLSDLGGDEGNIQLGAVESLAFADGFNSITIGDSVNGNGAINVDNQTFRDSLILTAPGSNGTIDILGPLTGTGDADFTVAAGSAITLSGDVRTAGGAITFNGPVILQNDALIDSTDLGAFAAGADVTFQNTVIGDGSPRNFAIDAGTGGDVRLLGDVGNANFIDTIGLRGRNITLTESITVLNNGDIDARRNFTLANSGSITAGNIIEIDANTLPTSGNFDGMTIRGDIEATNGSLFLDSTSGTGAGNTALTVSNTGSLAAGGDILIALANQITGQTALDFRGGANSGGLFSVESNRGDLKIDGPVSSQTGEIELIGVGGDNFDFVIDSGIDIADLMVTAGGGNNRLDFSGFSDSPVVIGVDQFTGIDTVIGSGDSVDRINLGSISDVIEVNGNNSGSVNGTLNFRAFENINSRGGNDTFNFNGLFTFDGRINGGSGDDILNIDTANGATPNNAVIEEGRISINPVWNFSNVEGLNLQMGDGNDTVTSQFTSFRQNLDGGGGTDTLIFVDAGSGARSPLSRSGFGPVSFVNFENRNFGEAQNPTPFPATPDDTTDPGGLLQIQVGNDLPDPTGIGNHGVITFAESVGTVRGGGGGLGGIENAFSAISAIAQQGIIMLGLDANPVFVPFSLDGLGGVPSGPGAQLLLNSLSPESNTELLQALGLNLGIYLVDPDGPFAIDLSGRPQAAATIQNLLAQLAPEAHAEVQRAIEFTVAVPLVPVDGPIQMALENAPTPQAVVIIFNQEIGAAALAELNTALGIQ